MNIILFCIISIIAIFALLIVRYKKYHISLLKTVIITFAIAFSGLLGSYIMFFLENGVWYGRSMFGGILLFPLFLFPVSLMLKIEPSDLFDYATIPGAFMLAFSKFNCYLAGCCDGKVIGYVDGIPNFFPSQLVEMSASLLIVVILFVFETKNKLKHFICPVCIVLYSIIRFILDFFRWSQEVFALGMTAGRFWSVVSFLIGIIWIFVKLRSGYLKKQDFIEKECSDAIKKS
jgi:phosphatidylglycerol:prolipoprotein diacylglycerol transferase